MLFPHRLLAKTPYELLNGKTPDVSFFRVFGCKCYIYKKRHHLGKFQRRCDIGFILGYSSKSKAYQVFNYATGVVEETYDVEFDETNGSQGVLENLDDVGDEPLREAIKNMPIGAIKPKEDEKEVQNIDMPSSSSVAQDDEKDERHANEDTFVSHEQARVQAKDVDAPGSSSQVVTGETHHYFKHTHKTKSLGVLHKGLLLDHINMLLLLNITPLFLVLSLHVALQDPDWVNAMHEELNNFTRNQIWTLEKPPQDARIIGTKWVFRNKQDDQGVIVRNKARLVAKGFSRVEGLDFGETFAPVARLEYGELMSKEFKMSMIGELTYFLSFQVKQMKDGNFL
jgi:hypothetical protein